MFDFIKTLLIALTMLLVAVPAGADEAMLRRAEGLINANQPAQARALLEPVAADLAGLREATGFHEYQVNFNGCGSLTQLEESMELFMDGVRPAL